MVLDRDHDGQADVFDRMVNFNSFKPAEDTAREFRPIEQPRPAEELVGTKVHFAAETINRMTIYSGVMEDFNSAGEVAPGGYFEPEGSNSPLFRFERVDNDTVDMKMNSKYAHMSEESLRMAASYEYAMWKGDESSRWRLNDRDTKLNAMVFASHSLYTDAGHRDREVWGEFLKAYGLPDISRSDVESAKKADDHYYSGSRASCTSLWDKLSEGQREGLMADGAGTFRLGEE